ncbi:MAG: hypothetical protein H7A45_17470 [Verrucomicrobiales bacterium]|nr:hypothetical protein [Verrucomicrobiales bacterium]
MKTNILSHCLGSRRPLRLAGLFLAPVVLAAPSGPEPQVPEGGGAPGAFPNTSVSAVNVVARGSSVFNSSVEVTGFDGQGPIAWSCNRYNRGDFAMRLSPGDPAAALGNLNQGFIEFGDNSPGIAASQAWRPTPALGVIIPTARQNGPIDWGDGEGPFYPTVALSLSSSGPGYSMVDGSFGGGDVDVNTGRAGTHGSSPEANFSYSVAWFPYDQGWLAGDVAGPGSAGESAWRGANTHAAGLSAGLIRWPEFPPGSATYGGQAELRLPGVDSLEDGMLFTTSSDGSSDVNLVGVAPFEDGTGWLVTIREDSAIPDPFVEAVVGGDQSEFEFVYVPFDAVGLIGGHINGANGTKRKAAGEFTIARTTTGTYELTVPGKTASDGTLLLQAAAYEPGTFDPVATRAFLSYQFSNGKFVIQARKTVSDTNAELADVDFYVAWVDFAEPLAPPAGPRLRSLPAVVVSGEGIPAAEVAVAASTAAPELLVTYIDSQNQGGFIDPISQQFATSAMMGRFYDAITLEPTGEPFIIFGSDVGSLSRCDAKYNPVSGQYVVVSNARAYNSLGKDVMMVGLVNPAGAGGQTPLAKAWVHEPDSDESYDDVAVAVSAGNGNILVAGERKATGEGEGTVGALYSQTGTLLTPPHTRLDLLQAIGDEDDPDVLYDPVRDAFIYISNTDNSNGSTGTLSNRIVGSIVDTAPDGQGQLVVRTEQPLGDGLPEGRAEGHPSAVVNPFNGELITAYDAGNGTSMGDLSFTAIGDAPGYAFTMARPEVPYLDGADGNPFSHQHPQLAVDPVAGVFAVGMNARDSAVGLPMAYACLLLGPDGQPLPSQLGAPYFLADVPGGIDNGANYHAIRYSPTAGSFVVAFRGGNGVAYLTSFAVTSSHLGPVDAPGLSIAREGDSLVLTWPASATGFEIETSAMLVPADWQPAGLTPTVEGDFNRVTLTPAGAAGFYRLAHP